MHMWMQEWQKRSKHTNYEFVVSVYFGNTQMTDINPQAALKNRKPHFFFLSLVHICAKILQHDCMHRKHTELNDSDYINIKMAFQQKSWKCFVIISDIYT